MNSEMVGTHFNEVDLHLAHQKALKLLDDFSQRIVPGLTEEEAHEILKDYLTKHQVEKLWHPSKIRFGINTQKSFKEPSVPNQKLAHDDIFFIDLGPVFNQHEADVGKTFVVGSNEGHHKLKFQTEDIFHQTIELWKSGASGSELYRFADKLCQDFKLQLNLNMHGHRLSDFPHAQYSKDSLISFSSPPLSNRWVLELHIISPELQRGAFIEGLLCNFY